MKYNSGFFTSYFGLLIVLCITIYFIYLYFHGASDKFMNRMRLLTFISMLLLYLILVFVMKILGRV